MTNLKLTLDELKKKENLRNNNRFFTKIVCKSSTPQSVIKLSSEDINESDRNKMVQQTSTRN